MNEELRMAELLCTRLCHDLTGPIGAVNNGAEFLSEEGFNLQSEAVDLIVSSAFSAVARLQFYRTAYGKVKDHGEASLNDKKKLAVDFFVGSKIELDWPDAHTDSAGIAISLKMVRLIFNLLIIASGTLIRGGMLGIRIEQTADGSKQITISGQGTMLLWDKELDKIFNDELQTAELSPRNVQAYLTHCYVKDLKASLTHTVIDNVLTLKVVQTAI